MKDLRGLPGEALVGKALADLGRGALTLEALLLTLAVTRLRRLGIDLPEKLPLPEERELALYQALGRQGVDDAYARYNALLRELTSFLEALELRSRAPRR
jgi:hypothetical protein